MEQIESREFPVEVALSISTGRLLCEFSAMHECIEFLAGEPVFTHALAYKPFADELAAAVKFQHPALDAPEISVIALEKLLLMLGTDTGQKDANALIHGWLFTEVWPKVGKTVALISMPNMRHSADAFTEPLKGKDVLFIQADAEER